MKFKVICGMLVPHTVAIIVEANDPDAACKLALVQVTEKAPELVPDFGEASHGTVFSFSLAAAHEDVSYPDKLN